MATIKGWLGWQCVRPVVPVDDVAAVGDEPRDGHGALERSGRSSRASVGLAHRTVRAEDERERGGIDGEATHGQTIREALVEARVHFVLAETAASMRTIARHRCVVMERVERPVVGQVVLVGAMDDPIVVVYVLIIQGMIREQAPHWLHVVDMPTARTRQGLRQGQRNSNRQALAARSINRPMG